MYKLLDSIVSSCGDMFRLSFKTVGMPDAFWCSPDQYKRIGTSAFPLRKSASQVGDPAQLGRPKMCQVEPRSLTLSVFTFTSFATASRRDAVKDLFSFIILTHICILLPKVYIHFFLIITQYCYLFFT